MDIDSTKKKVAELRARLRQLPEEIRQVKVQHVPPEEIAPRIAEAVNDAASRWRCLSKGLLQGERGAGSPTLTGSIELPWRIHEPMPWGALCASDADHASAILTTLLETEMRSRDYHPGPPLAERPGIIADLEKELQEVDAAEVALVDEAIECGLAIEHRTETFYKRARAEQEDRRQAALNAAYRGRVVSR